MPDPLCLAKTSVTMASVNSLKLRTPLRLETGKCYLQLGQVALLLGQVPLVAPVLQAPNEGLLVQERH